MHTLLVIFPLLVRACDAYYMPIWEVTAHSFESVINYLRCLLKKPPADERTLLDRLWELWPTQVKPEEEEHFSLGGTLKICSSFVIIAIAGSVLFYMILKRKYFLAQTGARRHASHAKRKISCYESEEEQDEDEFATAMLVRCKRCGCPKKYVNEKGDTD